jgi:hypothetical protein
VIVGVACWCSEQSVKGVGRVVLGADSGTGRAYPGPSKLDQGLHDRCVEQSRTIVDVLQRVGQLLDPARRESAAGHTSEMRETCKTEPDQSVAIAGQRAGMRYRGQSRVVTARACDCVWGAH